MIGHPSANIGGGPRVRLPATRTPALRWTPGSSPPGHPSDRATCYLRGAPRPKANPISCMTTPGGAAISP